MGYTIMKWPPYCPDFNPIEHIWVKLKEIFYKKFPEVAAMSAAAPSIKAAIGEANPR